MSDQISVELFRPGDDQGPEENLHVSVQVVPLPRVVPLVPLPQSIHDADEDDQGREYQTQNDEIDEIDEIDEPEFGVHLSVG